MKYKLTIACIFSMLVLSSTLGSANVTNEKTTEDVVIIGSDDCVVYIIEPELGYIYFQLGENIEPIKSADPWPWLENLNLALYICLGSQLFVDTFMICPDAECARFSIKRWLDDEEFVFWDCDLSNGASGYFTLASGLYKELRVDLYDSNDNWLAYDEVSFNILFIGITPS